MDKNLCGCFLTYCICNKLTIEVTLHLKFVASLRAHAFPVRVIRPTLWNQLPADVVLASSLSLFKYNLKNANFSYTIFGKA